MDDLAGVLGEVLGVADHAVVETGADGQQHVAVLHRHVGLVGAVHAWHADELAAAGGEAAQAHQGAGAGRAQLRHELVQLGRGVRQDDPAAGVDHRPLGGQQHLHGFLDLPLVALVDGRVGTHRDLALGRGVFALRDGDVLGDRFV